MLRTLILLCAALAIAPRAAAFGTINHLGQHAEHEHITRIALGRVLEPRTLDMLAGRRGTFGAIGAPDRPGRGLVSPHPPHCDGGDYLPAPNYPHAQAEARAVLGACRSWIFYWLDEAVSAAAPLAQASAEDVALECRFDGHPHRAKCAVLENLGLALHAAQDFYAHSNWVDRTGPGDVGPDNPPGLGHSGRAPWLDPRIDAPFPLGLISGCYDGFPEGWYCEGRVRHAALNKDEGPIGDAGATGAGDTSRGAINGNFERAVSAAIDDTRDKWMFFEERVRARYGTRAAHILCVVRGDDPSRC